MLLFFHALEKSPVVGLEKRFEDPKKQTYAVFDTPNNLPSKVV
jgi:hypothetical protein